MLSSSSGLRIEYSAGPAAPVDPARTIVRILYGARTAASGFDLELALPPLAGPALCEHWICARIEARGEQRGFRFVHLGARMFAAAVFEEDASGLQERTRQVYQDLLALAREQGVPRILRVWNHFPDINRIQDGMSRYQMFCEGRRQALHEASPAARAALPAVTTTGSLGPGFAVYFLAAREAGVSLENPRQTPPSDYPEHLGPHGPSFCRAVMHTAEAQGALYLSGTASITGHKTRHPGDASAQTQEVLRNHATMIDQACAAGAKRPRALRELAFEKVYLAKPQDLAAARMEARAALGDGVLCYFLHSPLCREDLLLEMESTFLYDAD